MLPDHESVLEFAEVHSFLSHPFPFQLASLVVSYIEMLV